MRPKENGEHYDFYQHNYGASIEHEKKAVSLTTDVKDRVISLLFGKVSNENRNELYKYMDARFKQCHSLALFVTDKDRKRKPNEKSKFAVLCDKLGLDPGHKEVRVLDNLRVLYSADYIVPAKLIM